MPFLYLSICLIYFQGKWIFSFKVKVGFISIKMELFNGLSIPLKGLNIKLIFIYNDILFVCKWLCFFKNSLAVPSFFLNHPANHPGFKLYIKTCCFYLVPENLACGINSPVIEWVSLFFPREFLLPKFPTIQSLSVEYSWRLNAKWMTKSLWLFSKLQEGKCVGEILWLWLIMNLTLQHSWHKNLAL